MILLVWASAALSVFCTIAFGSSRAEYVALEASFDSGLTWKPYERPQNFASKSMRLRLAGGNVPVIDIPKCALTETLRVQVWVDDRPLTPFGLSWENPACDENGAGNEGDTKHFTHVQRVKRDSPTWARFVLRDDSQVSKGEDQENVRKQKGFFSTYGLYILIFIAVALAQGIRLGLSELREEVLREENERTSTRGHSRQQIQIPAPRNKSTARSRKKTSKPYLKQA